MGWQREKSFSLHGPASSPLQDRFPFMPAGFFYCGFRVDYSVLDSGYKEKFSRFQAIWET
jgi:hypothetical protein